MQSGCALLPAAAECIHMNQSSFLLNMHTRIYSFDIWSRMINDIYRFLANTLSSDA